GLSVANLPALENIHRRYYRPGNLTIAIVGGFRRDDAISLARKYLIRHTTAPGISTVAPIDWAKTSKSSTVKWDSDVRAVCISYPPPAGARDRLLLSLYGELVGMRLSSDQKLKSAAACVYTSNHLYSVGA